MNDMNWLAVSPAIVLLAMACVVALVDLWVTDARRTPTYLLAQAALAAVAILHLLRFDGGDQRFGHARSPASGYERAPSCPCGQRQARAAHEAGRHT